MPSTRTCREQTLWIIRYVFVNGRLTLHLVISKITEGEAFKEAYAEPFEVGLLSNSQLPRDIKGATH